jgi:cupin fold WbuC family metalloprotein
MTTLSTVLFTEEKLCAISPELLKRLKKLAFQAPLKRARFCMHLSHDDAIQEMIIALYGNPYIRPHRHPNKTETLHLIEGEALVAFFDDAGAVVKTIHLSLNNDRPFLYRLSTPLWHTVVSLTEYVVFHEVVSGPFSPSESSEFPIWEPKDDPKAIHAFQEQILKAKK